MVDNAWCKTPGKKKEKSYIKHTFALPDHIVMKLVVTSKRNQRTKTNPKWIEYLRGSCYPYFYIAQFCKIGL